MSSPTLCATGPSWKSKEGRSQWSRREETHSNCNPSTAYSHSKESERAITSVVLLVTLVGPVPCTAGEGKERQRRVEHDTGHRILGTPDAIGSRAGCPLLVISHCSAKEVVVPIVAVVDGWQSNVPHLNAAFCVSGQKPATGPVEVKAETLLRLLGLAS